MSKYNELKENLAAAPRTWLVTGTAGFIGSHILYQLLSLNQKVIGVDNFITGSQKNLDNVKSLVSDKQWKNFKFFKNDIRELDICAKVTKGVDHVLHQAALGSVPRSIKDPLASNEHNVGGFLNMLTAAKDAEVKSFVYASSSSVYGDHPELPKTEDKIGKPLSPYAVTKFVNELYAQVYFKNYGFKSVGLRYFNVFGARQDPNGPYAAVIPLWVSSMIKNETVYINGDGKTSRDFCYVENAVQANLLAATCTDDSAFGKVFNVACEQRTTLNELYKILNTKLQKQFPNIKNHKPTFRDFRAGDVQHSLADISKARTLLGYEPTHKVDQGMDEALAWYISSIPNSIKKSA